VTGDASGTGIDSTVPHSARIWNYWLGGKDNYAVDRLAVTSDHLGRDLAGGRLQGRRVLPD
jgi:S-adenosyl methyltransferase